MDKPDDATVTFFIVNNGDSAISVTKVELYNNESSKTLPVGGVNYTLSDANYTFVGKGDFLEVRSFTR